MPTEQPPSCPIRGGLLSPIHPLSRSPFRVPLPRVLAKFLPRETGAPPSRCPARGCPRSSPPIVSIAFARGAARRRVGFYTEAADRHFSTAWFSRGREHIDSRDGGGRSDSAPFSLLPLLPRPSASLPPSLVARRPSITFLSSHRRGDIYGELYDSAFFFPRTIRGAVPT